MTPTSGCTIVRITNGVEMLIGPCIWKEKSFIKNNSSEEARKTAIVIVEIHLIVRIPLAATSAVRRPNPAPILIGEIEVD